MDDSTIISLYFARKETAISETGKKYNNYLMKIADNILGNRQDCEECVNDTMLSAWNSIPPANPQSLSAYLAKIARNKALTMLESRNAQKRIPDECMVAFDELENLISYPETDDGGIILSINSFLSVQKPENRMVFIGRYFRFDSREDIAEHLGISVGKVDVILCRMRKNLRKYLKREGYDV